MGLIKYDPLDLLNLRNRYQVSRNLDSKFLSSYKIVRNFRSHDLKYLTVIGLYKL